MVGDSPRAVAIIAGLDPSGGAGFIADTRIVAEQGLRPVGVITAVTEQTTAGVRGVTPLPAQLVGDQLTALLSDVEVAAVKIGMLGDEAVAGVVAEALALTAAPVVWDPVLLPTAGAIPLYLGDPREALRLLARHLTVITPNLAEAAVLAGLEVTSPREMRVAAQALAAGDRAVLVTGGHLATGPIVDILALSDRIIELSGERIETPGPIHGTGCALASGIAAGLARGLTLEEAVAAARELVRDRLTKPVFGGRGIASLL